MNVVIENRRYFFTRPYVFEMWMTRGGRKEEGGAASRTTN